MIVVNRFRVPEADADAFRGDLERAHSTLARGKGYLAGTVGRNVDDPSLWVLSTTWENVGSYRRALSSYDVKLHAQRAVVPCRPGAAVDLAAGVDEPPALAEGDDVVEGRGGRLGHSGVLLRMAGWLPVGSVAGSEGSA